MAVTYEWRGSGRRKGTRTFFDAMVAKVGQVEVSARVGSAVLLKAPPGELPYVALVENLYETPKGNQMMGTRWFYRVEDVPARQRPPGMLPHEVVLSNQRDVNSVESFAALAPIVLVPASSKLSQQLATPSKKRLRGGSPDYELLVCRREFDTAKAKMTPIGLAGRDAREPVDVVAPPKPGAGARGSDSVIVLFADRHTPDAVPLSSIELHGQYQTVSPERALEALRTEAGDAQRAMAVVARLHTTRLADRGVSLLPGAADAMLATASALAQALPGSSEAGVVGHAAAGPGERPAAGLAGQTVLSEASVVDSVAVSLATCTGTAIACQASGGPSLGLQLHQRLVAALRVLPPGWTEADGLGFARGFTRFGKQFHQVAAKCPGKSTLRVVEHYYWLMNARSSGDAPDAAMLDAAVEASRRQSAEEGSGAAPHRTGTPSSAGEASADGGGRRDGPNEPVVEPGVGSDDDASDCDDAGDDAGDDEGDEQCRSRSAGNGSSAGDGQQSPRSDTADHTGDDGEAGDAGGDGDDDRDDTDDDGLDDEAVASASLKAEPMDGPVTSHSAASPLSSAPKPAVAVPSLALADPILGAAAAGSAGSASTMCEKCFRARVTALKKPCKASWSLACQNNWWLCFDCCPPFPDAADVRTGLHCIDGLAEYALFCAQELGDEEERAGARPQSRLVAASGGPDGLGTSKGQAGPAEGSAGLRPAELAVLQLGKEIETLYATKAPSRTARAFDDASIAASRQRRRAKAPERFPARNAVPVYPSDYPQLAASQFPTPGESGTAAYCTSPGYLGYSWEAAAFGLPSHIGAAGVYGLGHEDVYRMALERQRLALQAAESAASRAAMQAFDPSFYGYDNRRAQHRPPPAATPLRGPQAPAPATPAPGAANFIDSVRWTYRSTPVVYATLVRHLDAFQRKEMGPETLVRNILSLLREAPDTLLQQLGGFVPEHLRFLVEDALRTRRGA
ncbi:hypothetical protein FNF28_00246 [Cafeteria roenbergensis]|uniref:BAH domain-containing protein n=1 Tax=Cafeteria roenbergensis TaxID=33653 RepID=A0A5A8E3B1_CAFRO|nr:hypothetical protein FNF28_00246 [Cafeteria roenbergensis]